MTAVAKSVNEWQEARDHNLAIDIANQVGKLIK